LENDQQLGGPGHTVAVDERILAGRNHRNSQARSIAREWGWRWVFGAVDLQTGAFFLELVRQRDAATLMPIIQRRIRSGTGIWSDGWNAYQGLGDLGYVHETVDRKKHFVDPVTGCNINSVQSRWAACKASLRRHSGVTRNLLSSYLDEYMWRAKHPQPNTFKDMLAAIRARYPV